MSGSNAHPLNLVFLGCGAAAHKHSRTIKRVSRHVRLHYASRDKDRAEQFRAKHKGVRGYGSYAEALADRELDIALIATPPASHLELTIAALEAGKHAIVEKPAFLNTADFARVRETCARTNCRVFVAENYYYKPLRAQLAQVIHEQLVGQPLFFRVNAAKYQPAGDWRSDPALAGGGALFEGGIHWVHLMANVGLNVRRVTGYRSGATRGSGESVVVVFEYDSGTVGTLAYSWGVPSPLQGLRVSQILGSQGTATFESNGIFLNLSGKNRRFRFPGFRDIGGYRGMFEDIFHAIRTGAEPQVTLDMAENDVRLVEAAYRSMVDEETND